MPLYPIECEKCGFMGDVFCRVSDLDKQNRVKCPDCGEACSQNLGAKIIAPGGSAIAFSGERRHSVTEGFHSSEVGEARQMFGAYGHCIKDDGSVSFTNRDEQRGYMQKKSDIYKKNTEGTN